jgi:hypothetical protein
MIAFEDILYRASQCEARGLLEKYQQTPVTARGGEAVA